MIRVVLADDHPALRLGVRMLLEQAGGIAVVGEANDGAEALGLVAQLAPDVLVLDCKLPDISGVAVAAKIQREGLPTRILVLSGYDESHYVRGMIAAGALGYLMKEEAARTIVAAVRAAARGEHWEAALTAGAAEASAQLGAALTPREHDVLRAIATGQSNLQISQSLGISIKTVEKHVTSLFAKLGADSRVELATLAVRAGLIGDDAER